MTLFFMACEDSGTSYQRYDDIDDAPDCDASKVNQHIYVMTEGEYEERVCISEGGYYEWGYPDSNDEKEKQRQKRDDCQCWGYYLIYGKEGMNRIYYEIAPGQYTGGDKYYVCGEDIQSFINQRPIIKNYMHDEDHCW